MISVDDATFEEIEGFRFENRFPTRSEATSRLIRLGLNTLKKSEEDKKESPILSEQEEMLVSVYRQLRKENQEEVINFLNFKISQNKNAPSV